MKGYVTIPISIYCKPCKTCGARPIISLAGEAEYTVKCPKDETHYKTRPGLIDIADWNYHNTQLYENMFPQGL